MISQTEVLMGRDKEFPLSPELELNLAELLLRLNIFRGLYGQPMIVSSGYRPGHYNSDAGGAKGSLHLTCQACDFKDTDGQMKKWIAENSDSLVKSNLYMEDPGHTSTWVHLQSKAPRSGSRVFLP